MFVAGNSRGGCRERILLAGLPEDIASLERSFTPDQPTADECGGTDRHR